MFIPGYECTSPVTPSDFDRLVSGYPPYSDRLVGGPPPDCNTYFFTITPLPPPFTQCKESMSAHMLEASHVGVGTACS